MTKFFNTSGPCDPDKHYMVPLAQRFAAQHATMQRLIRDERYFVLHAPRQTGKTTLMQHFARQLEEEGQRHVLYANLEPAQALGSDVEGVNQSVVASLEGAARVQFPTHAQPAEACFQIRFWNQGLTHFLSTWCAQLDKPLVLFLDEIDSLLGDGLLSILRQLRAGYADRPAHFPQAVALIGLRDVRDYRIFSDREQRFIIGGSAFNVKEQSIGLDNFSADEVQALFAQHTQATRQTFDAAALEQLFALTAGQPWLVNALGRELCFGDQPIANGGPINATHVASAAERLIKRRDVHLDNLADKLTEPRLQQVIQAILLGSETLGGDLSTDDQQYALDLGLVSRGPRGLEIANPLYREIIPRELTAVSEEHLGEDPKAYVQAGRLDIELLLENLIAFYRRNHDMITARKTYTEAAHHLVFLAWLHRIVNSGGTIQREYAIGNRRMDLHIRFGDQEFAIELKLMREGALEEGLAQLADYLHGLDLAHGYLILFRRANTAPADLGARQEHTTRGKHISVILL